MNRGIDMSACFDDASFVVLLLTRAAGMKCTRLMVVSFTFCDLLYALLIALSLSRDLSQSIITTNAYSRDQRTKLFNRLYAVPLYMDSAFSKDSCPASTTKAFAR